MDKSEGAKSSRGFTTTTFVPVTKKSQK